MAGKGSTAVLHFVRSLVAPRGAGDPADGELLRRFVATRDEAAFAALVARHGPMVLGVCRRVLADPHDAEDAFQATFLVLARRAGSLSRPGLLANWLYGVARRTALKARARSARRREVHAGVPDVPAPPDDVADLRPVLDEEIAGLPEKYRAPVILCYLEGRTNEEAARLLACPVGTLFTRLAWARDRLRARLTRRGLAPPAALFAAGALSAEASASLARTTVAAAVAFVEGRAVSTSITALAEGVLRVMLIDKCKRAAALLLVLALLGTGAGILAYQPAPEPVAVPAPKAPANDGKLLELMKKRRDTAQAAFDARMDRYDAGGVIADFALDSAMKLLNSELELSETQEQRIAACQAHRDRLTSLFQISEARRKAGKIGPADFRATEYHLLDAEVRLEQARRAAR